MNSQSLKEYKPLCKFLVSKGMVKQDLLVWSDLVIHISKSVGRDWYISGDRFNIELPHYGDGQPAIAIHFSIYNTVDIFFNGTALLTTPFSSHMLPFDRAELKVHNYCIELADPNSIDTVIDAIERMIDAYVAPSPQS